MHIYTFADLYTCKNGLSQYYTKCTNWEPLYSTAKFVPIFIFTPQQFSISECRSVHH